MAKVRKPLWVRLLKGLGWTLGVIACLLVVLQIVLSSGMLTGLVNKFAAEYVDGELSFGKVSANVFRRFPSVSVTLKDADLTYPHERFESIESRHPDVLLLNRGRGEQKDTLASFGELTAAVNPLSLIGGTIDISKLILDRPKAYAKYYSDSTANWNIFKFQSSEKEDTSSSGLPEIRVRKVALTGYPDIVFCDVKDTLHGTLRMKEMALQGNVSTQSLLDSKGKFYIDSLTVAGRLKADTLLFALDQLTLRARNRKANLHAAANAYACTRAFGRFKVPMSVTAKAEFPEDSVLTVNLEMLKADLAGIPLAAHGVAGIYSDRYFIDGEATIDDCRLNPILKNYVSSFWPDAGKIDTDASIILTALAQGWYSGPLGLMPDVACQLVIPKAKVSYSDLDLKGVLELDVEAEAVQDKPLNLSVENFAVSIPGLGVEGEADIRDLLGKNPVIGLDFDFIAHLDSLIRFMPEDSGYEASGLVEAFLTGKVKKSQMNMADIAKADLTGLLLSDEIKASSAKDTLDAYLGPLSIELSAKGNKIDDSVADGARMLALLLDVDTLSADYKETMTARASKVHIMAQNSADILDSKKKADFYPFCGELAIGDVFVRDTDSLAAVVHDSRNNFRIYAKPANPAVPVLSFKSDNANVFLRSDSNRIGVKGLSLDATAAMNSLERRILMKAKIDSLAKVYPDIPRDSLLRHSYAKKNASRATEEWMQEEDFKKKDINISLTGNLAKYFREWDINGGVKVENAFVSTPRFPLKNTVENLKGRFTNDRIDLQSFTLRSGGSDISAKGSVYGLRRALLGRGVINLDLDLTSDVLKVNELLGAYDAGSKVDEAELARLAQLDDDDFSKACVSDVELSDTTTHLIVVPGNVNANVTLEANSIQYSTLDIDWMEAEIAMKERCLQVSNTVATSNMGDIYFEGFYSTRTKKNIKTGFFLNLVDITAEKVIGLMPQIDTIMPMLKSFYGMLDCTLAATASMDENMNVLMPSVNGVTRITGKDLEIRNDKDISKIAKILMFRNKKTIHVDKMSVEGLLEDSKLEVFPFMLNVDRYKVALSGIQNMDSSFRYHVSVIKSPIWFKFGVDLYGDNFDKMKFKIGRAKYRSAKKVPVFTKVIDQTTISLSNSIHTIFEKGVDAAVAENEAQKKIGEYKESTGYVSAVDQPLEELSLKNAEDLKKIEEEGGVDDADLPADPATGETVDDDDDDEDE